MKTILISSFTNEAASSVKGEQLKEKLEHSILGGDHITVDFSNISRFASPFFNSSFASLAIKFGFKTIEDITLLNLSPLGKETFNTSIENAKLLCEKPEFTDEIKQIINNTPKRTE